MSELTEEIYLGDEGKTQDIAIYLFDIDIDGSSYGGHIPAKSWKDAEKQVTKFGAKIVGRSEEIFTNKICSICGGDMRIDTTNVKPIFDNDFPDIID